MRIALGKVLSALFIIANLGSTAGDFSSRVSHDSILPVFHIVDCGPSFDLLSFGFPCRSFILSVLACFGRAIAGDEKLFHFTGDCVFIKDG